jgi:hypothetical protein
MKRLTCVSPIAAKTAEALVQFHRGQDLLFTTSELLAGVRLVLDEPTARRAVYEWLDLFGYCVTDDWIVEPAGGWQEYGSDDVCATLYGSSPTHDPAAEFLRSSNGAAIAGLSEILCVGHIMTPDRSLYATQTERQREHC